MRGNKFRRNHGKRMEKEWKKVIGIVFLVIRIVILKERSLKGL
jgi:hypothetical protein